MAVLANVLFLTVVLDFWNFNTAGVLTGFLGCYIDKPDRILTGYTYTSASNTGDQCKQNCKNAGYRYAGTEYTHHCFCGNVIKNYPKASGCTAKCPGNKNEMCGGTWRISIYDTKDIEVDVPSGFLGCYIDKLERILSGHTYTSPSNTGDQCKQNCKKAGYRYAGTEYTHHCFCGNIIKNYPKASGCTAKCPGNKNEMCGGTWRISIYDTKDIEVDLPPGFLGCYKDKLERILSGHTYTSPTNTGDQSKQNCKKAGYRYAGTEYTHHCFCGNVIKNYPKAPNVQEIRMKCAEGPGVYLSMIQNMIISVEY